ncbi:hypothetical protein SAMN06269185_0186 [Natronoarchaeum philippinense]|uniref:DUF7344 domain-containing protein n=1 Tax=Natronoarchaeum philippinense TaxID=558529 RepID=A0A285N0W4_NATPI|nr:hypothetical protein [Natronoarchaeum philippinense]SNZ03082.1 hypothetical protein SAMN06269185_0186 [Natronoarchaeum philippinense]
MSNSPTRTPTDPLDPDQLPTQELLGAVASDRRRAVLSVLADVTSPIDAGVIARGVAVREAADDTRSLSDRIEDVHVSLHHVHLPKLADAGLLSYDSERGIIENVASP